MLPVVLVDIGLALALAGVAGCARPLPRVGLSTRRRSAAVALTGLALAASGFVVPAPERRVARVRSRLDEIVPRWQFAERHATRVRAAPAAVERAVRSVTAREIGLFRLLTWIRNPRLPGSAAPASILAAPPDEAILDVALRSGFVQLAASPDELVFGTIVVAPPGARSPLPAARYRDLVEPGWAKAVMNFRWYDDGAGWTRLETETRVFATDAASRRRFALYWRTIYPGSSLIRRTWLAAIRRRAEADATR